MKKIFALVLLFSLASCAYVQTVRYSDKMYEPKALDAQIDVFKLVPNRPFVEVAELITESNINALKVKAREIGADAIIITGRKGTINFNTMNAQIYGQSAYGSGVGVGTPYGYTAIAIKYQ
jgi:hypothetical protein